MGLSSLNTLAFALTLSFLFFSYKPYRIIEKSDIGKIILLK